MPHIVLHQHDSKQKAVKEKTAEPWILLVYVYHLRYGSNKPDLPGMTPSSHSETTG